MLLLDDTTPSTTPPEKPREESVTSGGKTRNHRHDVIAVTCSGDRPHALAICKELMDRQTVRPAHFISDDPSLDVAPHLARSLRRALEIPGSRFFLVVEDDDWYPEDYVEKRLEEMELGGWNAVGSDRTRYYNVPQRRWREMKHPGRSSGCAMVFDRRGAMLMVTVLDGCTTQFADLEMCRAIHESSLSFYLRSEYTMTGIKGLPGRPGVGGGHRNLCTGSDPNLQVLRSWVGEEWAERYDNLLRAYP